MAIVNTNNYKEALKYLNNSSIYEQNKSNINSVINYLDSRVLSVINEDLNSSKETFNNEIEAERTIKTTISTKIERYIEIESKARERAGLITGSVIGAAGAAVAMAAAPVAVPIVGAVAGVTAVGVTKKDATLQFFKDVGEGILNTGAKVVDGVKTIATNVFTGIGNLFKKAGNAVVALGEKTVSLCENFINGAAEFVKSAAKVINKGLSIFVSSVGNLVMSLVEGVASFAEAIVDCGAMLGGVVCSLFTGAYDLYNWIGSKLYDTEFQSATKAMWTKGIMPFVGQDWTDKTFDAVYQTGFFKAMEENAIGPLKREGGTLYSIGKGIGYTTGLIALTISTAGVGSSTIISSAAAGAGAMGKAGQKNYNKLSDEEKQDLGSIAKVVGLSALSGGVEGAAWYLTFGGGKTKLVSKKPNAYMTGKTNLWNKGVDLVLNNKVTSKLPLGKVRELLTASSSSMAKMGIQFKKTYVNAIIDAGATSSSVGETLDKALTKETFTNAVTNAAISLVYDNTFGKGGIVKKQQTAAKDGIAAKYDLKAKQEQMEILNRQLSENSNIDATASLFDSADDIAMEQSKKILAEKALLKKEIDIIQSIQDANTDGISKTAGGFIKKLMDVRKYPDILNEFIGTEAA